MEYVGFDVSKEETAFCVKDGSGKVLARGRGDHRDGGFPWLSDVVVPVLRCTVHQRRSGFFSWKPASGR